MPTSEADLAAMLANNKSLKLKPEYRISPSTPRQEETAISPRVPPVPVAEPQPAPKADLSTNRKNLRKIALAMSEDDLQTSIIELAHFYGWKCAHFRSVKVTKKDGSTFWQTPVAADGEGFPDLILVRRNRVLAVELKSERGKPDPAQREWLHIFMLTRRVETFIWKPSQWLDLTIDSLLR